MEPIVIEIHKTLIKNKITLAVAESCTGGLLSAYLTQLSGSSKYFSLGIIAYSNKSKEELLGIPRSIIAKFGAVSNAVAELMAERVKKIAKADFGIGITGIAGPGGAVRNKPVGSVFIAINGRKERICKKLYFKGSRSQVRKKAALKSLQLLRKLL